MSFFSGGSYTWDGVPWTSDKMQFLNPIGLPAWFQRGSLHQAFCVQVGPYSDPNGLFQVLENEMLVVFPVPQAPEGTEAAINNPRQQIYAIFPIDRNVVTPGSLIGRTVDSEHYFAPGDKVAIWFNHTHPAVIVGRHLDGDEFERDNSGSILKW